MASIFETAREAVSSSLIKSYFPNGDERGDEYWITSPFRHDDKNNNNFSINLDTGFYFDWADSSDNGKGDFIKLVSLTQNCTLKEAAEKIARESGKYIDEPKPKRKKKELPDPVIIPENKETEKSFFNRVTEKFFLDKFGTPKKAFKYRDIDGKWLFTVCRFEKEVDGKKTKNPILFYLGTDKKWYMKWHEKLQPFSLYGVEKLKKHPTLPVLIVEGEKCADVEVKGYNLLSWLGGTKNLNKTDFSILKDREVFIWPDCDSQKKENGDYIPETRQPGLSAALQIKTKIGHGKILDIYKKWPLGTVKSGYDIADFVEDGKDPIEFIENNTPELDVELIPRAIEEAFVDDYFGENNLTMENGRHYEYLEKKHYWRKASSDDIVCNCQTWLKKTGLQYVIEKATKGKAGAFFNEVKAYINRHATGYIEDSNFADAANSPWIHTKNGAIEITEKTSQFHRRNEHKEEFFRDLYPLHCLDFGYEENKKVDPAKDCPGFLKFCTDLIPDEYILNKKGEEKKAEIKKSVDFLSSVLTYAVTPIKKNEYFFALWGKQGTGKSFFINIVKSIIGEQFCVERSMEENDNRFAKAGLFGKKIYIEPDAGTRNMLPEAFIKSLSGQNKTTIEEKNKPAQDGVSLNLSMFFLSNYELRADGIEGLDRRIVLIPFKNVLKNKDRRLLEKMTGKIPHDDGRTFDERPAILSLIMDQWEVYAKNNYELTPPEWSTAAKNSWITDANSVKKFMADFFLEPARFGTFPRKEVYNDYKNFCSENDRKPKGLKNFYEEFRLNDNVKERKSAGMNHFDILDPAEADRDVIPF